MARSMRSRKRMVRFVPLPALKLALAARVFADVEILEFDGEAHFEDFRIGEPRIGHVGVDAGGAVETAAGILKAGGEPEQIVS
jgi:hypothetical protein